MDNKRKNKASINDPNLNTSIEKSNIEVKTIQEESRENENEDDVSNIAELRSISSQSNKLGAVKKFKDYKLKSDRLNKDLEETQFKDKVVLKYV